MSKEKNIEVWYGRNVSDNSAKQALLSVDKWSENGYSNLAISHFLKEKLNGINVRFTIEDDKIIYILT